MWKPGHSAQVEPVEADLLYDATCSYCHGAMDARELRRFEGWDRQALCEPCHEKMLKFSLTNWDEPLEPWDDGGEVEPTR